MVLVEVFDAGDWSPVCGRILALGETRREGDEADTINGDVKVAAAAVDVLSALSMARAVRVSAASGVASWLKSILAGARARSNS